MGRLFHSNVAYFNLENGGFGNFSKHLKQAKTMTITKLNIVKFQKVNENNLKNSNKISGEKCHARLRSTGEESY